MILTRQEGSQGQHFKGRLPIKSLKRVACELELFMPIIKGTATKQAWFVVLSIPNIRRKYQCEEPVFGKAAWQHIDLNAHLCSSSAIWAGVCNPNLWEADPKLSFIIAQRLCLLPTGSATFVSKGDSGLLVL
jgi:hypothetical protein